METDGDSGPAPVAIPKPVDVRVRLAPFKTQEEYILRLEELLNVAWADCSKLRSNLDDFKKRTKEVTEKCKKCFTGLSKCGAPLNQEPSISVVATPDAQDLKPLEIPEILELVFGYLGLPELKTCRETCKSWNLAVISRLSRPPTGIIKLNGSSVGPLIRVIERSPNFPFRNFEMAGTFEDVFPFFEKFGSMVRYYNFVYRPRSPFCATYDFEDLGQILKTIPNVETLNSQTCPKLFQSETRFNSLRALNLSKQGTESCVTPNLPPHLDTLTVSIGDSSLNVQYKGSVRVLKVQNFRIKEESEAVAAAFRKLLVQYRKSLTKLIFYGNSYRIRKGINLPEMNLLTVLRILQPSSYFQDGSPAILFSPARPSQLPVLKHVDTFLSVLDSIFMSTGKQFQSVRTLFIREQKGWDGNRVDDESELLEKLPSHFPGLSTLELLSREGLIGTELEVIFGNTTLENLNFVYSDLNMNINNVLCGLPPEVSTKDLLLNTNTSKPNWVKAWENLIEPGRPSLRDLKRLRSLRIAGRKYPLDEAMTVNDVSGFMAFGMSPCLRFLGLCQIGKVSKESLGHRIQAQEPGPALLDLSDDVRRLDLLIVDHWTGQASKSETETNWTEHVNIEPTCYL